MSNNVRSAPLADGEPVRDFHAPRRSGRPQLGLVRGATIERAFVAMLYLMAFLLGALSVLGTFFGMRGLASPPALGLVWQSITSAPEWVVYALVMQGALTIAQWGARQMAKHDRRWWLLYIAVLSLSVYYNLVAFFGIAVDALGLPWLLAAILIIAGDALPELVVVRR